MLLKTARVFVRAIRSWPEANQEEVARAWCEKRGVRHVAVYRASEHSREAWLRALRLDEAAVLPSLHVLAELRPKAPSPSIDFGKALATAQVRCRIVVDALADCTSEQAKCWPDVVAKAQRRIQSGRALPKKEARRRGKIGGAATRAKSVRRKWQEPWMDDKREVQASIWNNKKLSEEARRRLLCDELRGLSPTTLWRVFNLK